jgi:hypothetical protein
MPAGIAYGRGSRTVCNRIQGARWGSIAVLFAVATLLSTLVPNRAAAQADSLVIETVPPIEGVTFKVDGETYSTDEEGVAVIDEVVPGESEVLTRDRVLLTGSQRIEFVTWSDGVAESNRVVDIEGSTRLQVGFRVDFLVAETFRTSDGDVLSPESVGPYAVVDDAGESTTFPGSSLGLAGPTATEWERFPPGTRWLPANRIVPENDGLGTQEASYAVRWVSLDGERVSASNVWFTPSEGAEWGIEIDASTGFPGSMPRELILVPLLIAGAIVWLLVRARNGRRSESPTAGVHRIPRGLERLRKPVKETTRREFVRAKMRNGRTVEGWRLDVPGADPSEAVILSVTGVWGPDGTTVPSQPMDSLLLPSQIMKIESILDPPSDSEHRKRGVFTRMG